MSDAGARAIEHAEAMVALENDVAIAEIRESLARPGSQYCMSCGDEIEPKRRAAMPSARRCADCQSRIEQAAKRG